MKWLVECMDENGNWNKFNYFTGSYYEVKEKCSTILLKTKYYGIKITQIE